MKGRRPARRTPQSRSSTRSPRSGWRSEGTFTARRNVELLRSSPRAARAGARAPIELRFLRPPVAIHGDGPRRGRSRSRATSSTRDEDGGCAPGPPTSDRDDRVRPGPALRRLPRRPLPDVPFDERSFVLPNERGRVLDADRAAAAGVYAVGWIKRGPTGILGTNKRDADETVAAACSRTWTRSRRPSRRAAKRSMSCSTSTAPGVTVDGWRAIDALERKREKAQKRQRMKLADSATRCWTPPARARERAQRAWRCARAVRHRSHDRLLPRRLLPTGPEDLGIHTICAVVTAEFLEHQRSIGNDLTTPMPLPVPGLLPGDRWCVTAANWLRAHDDGAASYVVLAATNDGTSNRAARGPTRARRRRPLRPQLPRRLSRARPRLRRR